MKPLFNKHYDLQGAEISRLGKTALFSKVIPIGNLRGGPGLRCLCTLTVLHYFGSILYRVTAKHGARFQPVRRLLSGLRQKTEKFHL